MSKWLGLRLRFHPLFVVFMLVSVLTGFFVEMITLFGIVFIHELGHVTVAKGFGWKIKEIQFLPFGGVAVTEQAENVPAYEEMMVALAGPAQNALMIGVAMVMREFNVSEAAWWQYFMSANLMIGLFNLLPVLPLDGGKILQALISYWLSYHQVMVGVTTISLLFSAVMVLVSFLSFNSAGIQLNLLVIGMYLFLSNWQDYRNIPFRHIRFLMGRQNRFVHWIRRGTLAQPIVVHRQRKIGDVLRMFKREKYHLIYVLNERGAIQTVFPEQKMIDAYLGQKPGTSVSDLFM